MSKNRIIEVKTLEAIGTKLVPRPLSQSLHVPFLKMGTVSDSLQEGGIRASLQMSHSKQLHAYIKDSSPNSKRTEGSSKGPTDFSHPSHRVHCIFHSAGV